MALVNKNLLDTISKYFVDSQEIGETVTKDYPRPIYWFNVGEIQRIKFGMIRVQFDLIENRVSIITMSVNEAYIEDFKDGRPHYDVIERHKKQTIEASILSEDQFLVRKSNNEFPNINGSTVTAQDLVHRIYEGFLD